MTSKNDITQRLWVAACRTENASPDSLLLVEAAIEISRLKASETYGRRLIAEMGETIGKLLAENIITRTSYVTGKEYEAGNWSRRNIEAFWRDQDMEVKEAGK